MIKPIQIIIKWSFVLLVPLVLIMAVIRLLMTPQFIRVEYNTPNFPVDQYGFSLEDRLTYAPLALNYLLNDSDISYLGDMQLKDGSPMYNERELGHMEDVKNLTQSGLNVWYICLMLFVAVGLFFRMKEMLQEFKSYLGMGGKFTVGLITGILLIIAISFEQLFIGFHNIFFEGDSWLFYYSDTLIRLFPMRFWQDTFIIMGLLTLGAGGLIWYYFGRLSPKNNSV